MTAISEQLDNSKARIQELRDQATEKAKGLQRDAIRSRDILIGRAKDGGLATAFEFGANALGAAANLGKKLPLGSEVAQTLESRANDLRHERDKITEPPIPNYDELNVKQVSDALENLNAWELVKVREYEKEHKDRKTVFAAIERRL